MLLVQRCAKTKGLRTTVLTGVDNMGRKIISFKGWGKMNISNLATVAKISFSPLETKKFFFSTETNGRKISNFKIGERAQL